jgi:hypothetical protein
MFNQKKTPSPIESCQRLVLLGVVCAAPIDEDGFHFVFRAYIT